MESETPMWRGFVINQSEKTYTVLSERDKKRYELNKVDGKVKTGILIMPDGHVCNVDDNIFNDSRLFSACREYCYDLKRHKDAYQRRKATKQQKEQLAKDSILD